MSPKNFGLDTVEYICEKCGLDFEVAYPDEESIPRLSEMSCPIIHCRGKVGVEDYDEEISEKTIKRIDPEHFKRLRPDTSPEG